jgi:hypothetical protein
MVRTASGLWSSTTHTQFDAGLGRVDGRGGPHDHKHRLRTVSPYEYRDAATLLGDFWDEVYAVLKERRVRQ